MNENLDTLLKLIETIESDLKKVKETLQNPSLK